MNRRPKKVLISLSALLAVLVIVLFTQLFLMKRIYPGVYVAGVHLAGLTEDQAQEVINQTISQRMDRDISFSYQSQQFGLSLTGIQGKINSQPIIDEAFLYGHSKLYLSPQRLFFTFPIEEFIEPQINNIAQAVNQPAIDAQIKVIDDNVVITQSQEGVKLDENELKKMVIIYLNQGYLDSWSLPVGTVQPHLSYQAALSVKAVLDELKKTPIKLVFEKQAFTLDFPTILNMLDLQSPENGQILDRKKVEEYVNNLAIQINRPVQEPLFSFDGKKVTEFKPPQEGRKLDEEKTVDLIAAKVEDLSQAQNANTLNLPVSVVPIKNQLTNELGIKELAGEGSSRFSGSIPNRIFNIGLAASRINGVLIAPGSVFSFNETVGDISAVSGYKQAYVIKGGRTVLDDGGGVCQVSTTLFRAVLNAGLPIVARTAHAYRVGYYEQGSPPGLDATVFSPSVDFKFKNDTGRHILIQASLQGEALYVNLFGTTDGRISQVSTPIVSNQTPPPADLKQDDPVLPRGTVKQVDWSAWGAKVVFTRTVKRGDQTLVSETFSSNYRPWQAVYLVGTREN